MLSKNNYQERLRKMEARQDRFSIRKFSMGAASVLIGFFFIGMSNGEEVNADTLAKPDQDNGHPEQASGQSAETKVPKKVIVDKGNTPVADRDAVSLNKDEQAAVNNNKTALKQNSVEKTQAETVNKNQVSQKTQEKVKQIPNETSVKTIDQTATSKTTVSNNKQEVATAQKVQQAAVKDTNKTAVTDTNNAAIQSKTETAALTDKNESKIATTNNDQTVKESDKKTPNIAVDPEVAAFQKEYQDLQTNFDKLSADERTQRAAKIQADYEKMSTQAKTQFALANGVNQQLYSVNNGVADVSTFADFTKALCDKNVTTINMTGDITAADNQSALKSGGTGLTGSNLLNPYELSADHFQLIGSSPYSGIARTVTIEGNNHTLDMNKWTITFSRQNYGDNPWNFTFKDMTFKTNANTSSYGPLYFYHGTNALKSIGSEDLAKTNVTFDNVKIEAGQALMASQVNTIFSGNTTLNTTYSEPTVNSANITIADNSTLNASGGTTILDANDTLTIGNNAKVTMSTNGQDLVGKDINVGTNATLNLTDSENTDLGNFANNAVTFTDKMNIGDGATININTGDAKPDSSVSVHDVRGIYGNTDTPEKAATLSIGKNAHINMSMGTGHSTAILTDNMDVDEGTQILITTKQDNNNRMDKNDIKFGADPNFNHYAPITMAFDSDGELHLKDGAKLQVIRDTQNAKAITPMISFGNGGDGRKQVGITTGVNSPRYYTLTVDGGATLDLQDDTSSQGIANYKWDYSGYLDSDATQNIFYPGMISMFGTNSMDTVQLGSEVSDGKYIAPAYINLQRRGKQWGRLLNLEGKAIPGKFLWNPNPLNWAKNIQNIAILYGDAPLAQWNGTNKTATPDNAWNIEELATQNGGGDTSANYVPADLSKLTNDGFIKSKGAQNVSLGQSNGIVVMPGNPNEKNSYATYSDTNGKSGEVTGSKQNLMKLQSLLDNFNWWKARRISYGTDLLKTDSDHGVTINPSDLYTPTVAPQTYTEGKYENNAQDFANNKVIIGVTDASGKQISTDLDKIISNEQWGIDWTHTEFKNILDSNGKIDQTKLAALSQTKGKSDTQAYDDTVEYNAYNSLIESINNPDGSSGYDPSKTQFKLSDNTKEEQTYNIPMTVTFSDGSANVTLVPVTVKKAKQNTLYQPSYITQTVEQGKKATVTAPSFKSVTNNADGTVTYTDATAPTGVTYALTDSATKPDFVTLNSDGTIRLAPTTKDAVGVYSIPVTVTYADKSTDNISALVDVTDGKSTVIWGKTNPDGSVKGAVVVKPGTDTIHKTSDTSSSIDSLDPKKAVSEIDIYTADANDSTKLDQTTYTYNNGAYVDGEKNSIDDVSVSYVKNAGLDTTTGNSTTLPITVTFGTKSLPAQKGIINNGAHTNLSENINFAGASAILGSQISLPKGYDVIKDLEGYFTSDRLATLINHSALDKIDPAFKITGYSLVGVPDTSSVKAEDMTVRISFADKMGGNPTYLDVQIPNGINVTTGDAGQYNPTYADTVDSKQQLVTVNPSFGNDKPAVGDVVTYALGQTSEQNLPAAMKQYVHVDNNTGAITIDQAAMNDTASYEIPVVVTYKDGTQDQAVAKVYEVKGKDVADPTFASDAISNFENLPSGTTAKWETAPDPHQSSQSATVDVTLPDNKTTTVTVNVTNNSALKPNTTIVYGQDTTTTITVETPSYHKTSADNNPAAPRVSKVTIVTDKGVTTTYNLSSDGKTYTSTDGKKSFSADQIKTAWEDGYKLNTNASNFSTDGSQTTLVPVKTDKTSDEWDGTHNSKYRVDITLSGDAMTISGIPDGDAGWSNAYANIYGAKAASASDANKQLKAVQNVDSSLADPSAYVDTSDLTTEHNSKVESVSWNTKPDLTKAGTITPNVDINFVDGTKLTIPVKITVAQSDANKFETDNTDKNPLTQTISVHTGATVAAGDAIKGFSDATKTKYGIVSDGTQFNETVPTTDIGTTPYAATVKFADGSSTTVNIPVKVYTDQSNFDDANKNNALTKEISEKMCSVVAATDAKNGVKEDSNNTYHIVWTDTDNLKAPRFTETIDTSTLTSDTNPAKSYAATIYFEDGTSTTVNIPVKIIGSDASKFAQDNKDNVLVQTISKGRGYQFKDTDASQGIKKDPNNTYNIVWTDKDSLKAPRFNDVSKIDSSKETSMPTDYDATVYFKDGTKLGVKIPVIITDQATDHQNDLKTKTYQVDQNGTVSAGDVIDTTSSKNVPEGTTYAWSNKTLDTSKVGTQEVTIIVTYPDGTKGTANGKVTVEATPETTTVTLHQGVIPTSDDATSSITNLIPTGQDGMPKSVAWKATPSTDTTGKSTATVTVTYNDGYTKEVIVPINVWKTTKGSDVTKPSADTHDIYREITRTITVDNGTPQIQKVVFTRDKYTDTTDAAAQPTYSDWVAKDGKDTFAESAELTKDGYTATVKGTDITGKPIALTANGTIAGETVTADSQSENITVTNTANDQTVAIKFINAKDDSPVSVATPETFTGKTDGSITINPTDITIPTSYKLDKDFGLPTTYKFTADKDQTITVKLDHLITLDPTNPDVAKDPKNSDMFESITRKINYTDPTKADAQQQTITQTVKFQRTKTVNDSDSTDITYGDWTPADSNKTAWDAYTVPTFTDYTVTAKDDANDPVVITNGQIASVTLEPGNKGKTKTADQTINLTYTMTNAGHFKKDNANDAATQLIRVKKGTDKKAIDGKQGIKSSTDYTVQSVTFTDLSGLDTSVASPLDKPFPTYGATITFTDGSTATVNIPIQVYDKATDFEQDNQKNPLTQEVDEKMGALVPAIDAVKGFTSEVITKYGIVSTGDNAPKFTTTIDTSKVTTIPTDYEATINFDDGSTATVKIPVKIIASDASAFDNDNQDNALVKQITWGKRTIHQASEAINGIITKQGQTDYHVTGASFNAVPSTDAVHPAQNFAATISFEDGTTTTVEIPVAITDNASDDKTITKNPIVIIVDPGTTPQTPDPKNGVKDPSAPQGTTYQWKDTPTVPDPGDPKTPATVVVKYPDGTQKEVPTTIVTDYKPEITTITTPKDVAPSADKGISNLNKGKGYPTSVVWKTTPDVSQIGSTTGTATVSYANGVTQEVTIPITVVKNDGETYDPQATKEPVKTPQGTQVDPSKVVDPSTLPTDPKDTPTITWANPKNVPDPSKPGTQPANVDITYPDGTLDHVPGKVTVEATPEIGTISTNQNVVPDLTNSDNAKKVVTNLKSSDDPTADGYPISVKWTTDPDVSKAGQTTGNVTITYKDGYTTTANVSINVIGVEDGKEKANQQDSDVYKDFTRTITVDGTAQPAQHVILTRIKYTDTSKPVGQQVYYSNWVSDNASFAEVDVSKDGYSASAIDGSGKTIALTSDSKVPSEAVALDDASVEKHAANEVIKVTHTANTQSIVINYVDAKSGNKVDSQTISGVTDGQAKIKSALTIPSGYQLNDADNVPETYTFKASGNDPITVKLDKINTVNPDPTRKDDQKDLFKTITRTITYTDPTTNKQVTVTQGVDFERSKKVNNTNGAVISYGDWTLVDAKKSSWDAYTVPIFTDYTVSAKDDAGNSVDIRSGQIAGQTVTAQTANTHITLTYSETDAGKFKDKNKDNSQVQTILVTQNSDPTQINASDGIRNLPRYASVAFDNGVVIDTKTLGTTSYPATITFADNTTAKVEIPVKVYNDATVFNEDQVKKALTQTITEKQGTDVDPTDAIKGFSADVITKYNIDTSNFNEKIDTSTVTTTPVSYAASVYFKDGSHTTVKIPVQIIASEASQFNDAVKKDATIVQGITVNKYDIVAKSDALKGIKNPATYNVIAANFDEDVDTSVVGKKTYPVIVTFNDGSTTTVQMSVTVEDSQASKFKDNYKTETQVVEELLNSQVPVTDAMKGIKNAAEIGATNAKFNYDVDTTVLGSKDYDATVSFSDGSSTVVPITVKVVSLADKFDDTVDLTAVTRKIGQTVKNTDAIEGVVDATKHGVQSAVFTEDVPTNEQGSTPYDATLTFTDGSKKDVKITVNVGANEASTFNKAQLVPLVKIPVGTKIDPADTTNAQAALKDPSQIGKTITSIQYVTIPDTSKPRNIFETPVKITFNDGSTKTFEQAIQITSEADNYTGTPQNIDILHNITIDPENTNNAKGAATDPDNTIDHIQFVDPKDIDPSTLGKQIAPAIITFKDGSTKTISVPVTIVPNEADKFSPNDLNKPITVKKNTPISKGAEVADAINPIKKTQDNVTSITYETVPDTTVPGTTYPAVKVTFNDGSSITTNLPVVVSTTKTGNPYQAGTQGVNDASNYYIYREIMIHRPDSDQEDIVTQVIHFIRKDKNGNSSYTTDGKTTYVPWTVADSDGHSTGTATGHFKEYETPRVADYAANKSLIADEEVAGDPYGATPVSRDRVEKVDINYNFDMNQVSMAYLAVPASFTPGDNLFLQLAAYDNKTGKQIKLPRSVKFEAKSLPDGVKLDEQTGSVTVPKGMQVGKNQVQVMALAQTGQKEVDAQLNVVNKPDSGQTTPTTPVNPTPITPSTPTTPTTPTKQTDADKFAPQTQDITTTVDDLPDASSAISNLDNLPSGTKASWQTAPEVSQSGSKTANIVVTYPDGSQDTTSTTVIVAEKVPEKKAIVPIGQKIKTKKNVLPKPIKGIKNRKLMPVGTKYAWKKKPNVSKIGTIKAIVKVTYPNGKKFNIKVKIIVSDVIKTHASTTVDHLPSASSMLENAPAGTKAHWIKKPDVSKPGQAKGRIGIDYPNGQKEKKDVFISVKPGNSLSMNSTKHVERSSSHSPKSESYAYNSHLGASTNGTSGRQASVKAESINGFTSSSSPSPLAEIGRQGQIRANKNLRSELGKNNSENVKNNTNSKELPETGEKDSELEALGMMAASLSLIGLAGVKKRKH